VLCGLERGQAPGEVLDRVRPELDDVEAELELALDVGMLDVSVAASCSVAAEHDQVGAQIVFGVLEDVVQGELADGAPAQRALLPLLVEIRKQARVSYNRGLLPIGFYGYAVRGETPNNLDIHSLTFLPQQSSHAAYPLNEYGLE